MTSENKIPIESYKGISLFRGSTAIDYYLIDQSGKILEFKCANEWDAVKHLKEVGDRGR